MQVKKTYKLGDSSTHTEDVEVDGSLTLNEVIQEVKKIDDVAVVSVNFGLVNYEPVTPE